MPSLFILILNHTPEASTEELGDSASLPGFSVITGWPAATRGIQIKIKKNRGRMIMIDGKCCFQKQNLSGLKENKLYD